MKHKVLLAVLVAAVAGLAAASLAASTNNILIKASGQAVYYLGTDNKRYVFPNEKIFKTWYADFSGVVTVSDAQMATYPIGGNVKYHSGTRLVKITTDPKVYAVGSGGNLYSLATESAAALLYGSDWSKRVDDLPDAYFTDYRIGSELDASAHPEGTLFRYTDTEKTYYVLQLVDGELRARGVTDTQLALYGLQPEFALAVLRQQYAYPTAPPLAEADLVLSYPHQPGTGAPAPDPDETNGEPSPSPEPGDPTVPAPSAATLSAATNSTGGTALTIVKGDGSARLYAFTLTGDAKHAVNVTRIRLRLYIDAGGTDKDFDQGVDLDDPTQWTASQVISGMSLRDLASGKTLASLFSLPGDGVAQFNVNLAVEAGKKMDIELVASVNTAPSGVRLSASLTPSTDLVATAPSSSGLTISPATATNGDRTPNVIATVRDFGSMKLTTTSSSGDGVRPLGIEFSPFSLVFTSTGEPFTVTALSLTTTSEGTAALVANELLLTYKKEDGTTEIDSHNSTDNNIFRFINLAIFVPKGGSVTIPVTVRPSSQIDVFSGSRLQLKLHPDYFSADSVYSKMQYTDDHFADSARLTNATSSSPLTLFRQSYPQFSAHAASPTGSVERYAHKAVLTFTVTAKEGPVKLNQLTFRIDTSDINVTGDDNDFFERFADTFANESSSLYTHAAEIDDRGRINAQSVTLKIYDFSAGNFDDTPAGLQTGSNDYGLLVYQLGTPITLIEDETISFDFDLDTTLFSTDTSNTLKVRLLGDTKSTALSQANFLYDDGSNIKSTGYLVPGLDLTS